VIPHDATLVISALVEAGGECDVTVLERQVSARLQGGFAVAGKYLLDSGLVVRQLNGAGLASIVKLTNPKKYKLNKVDKALISQLVGKATDQRNFSAAYQSVVAGKTARADPLTKFVEEMSPIDRSDFWKGWLELSEEEQDAYRTRIARLTSRSRRD
tara:strand:- start:256 stop:726 length:471 start_codon:yes stop_codon:yes gene_type:complete